MKKSCLRKFFLTTILFVVNVAMLWGQTGTDRSGVFYFVNCGSGKTKPDDPKIAYITDSDNYFYLIPADNPQQSNKRDAYYSDGDTDGDSNKPYLTTYRTKKDAADVPEGVTNRPHNSVWIVKFASTDSGTDYYYIIHAATGKYVVYEPPFSTKNNRKSVHLLTTDSPGENAKFAITLNSSYYNFRPKSISEGNRYFNTSNRNFSYYYSHSSTKEGDVVDYYEGLVGLYSATTDASSWRPETTLLSAPTINFNSDVNAFSISYDKIPAGFTLLYTVDGSEPTIGGATTSTYSSPVPVTESLTVKAVVVRYGMVLTEVAEKVVAPAPCATPVITFDYTTSNVSISCTTPNSTIYYTTDGSAPTTSSTQYSIPFSVNSTTTVKAIASHTIYPTSDVAELAITQVATPTIQDNGRYAISITSATPGATIYYTTDGSTPTTSSTRYTSPLTENVSNVTIKAIAVKAGMITSLVGSGTVKLQCATPVITRVGMTFTLSCSKPTDANLYYTLGGGSEVEYTGTPVAFSSDQWPLMLTAVARHSDYTESETASMELKIGTGTPSDPYLIYGSSDFADFVTNVNNGTTASASYKLGSDVSASGMDAITTTFTGTFDGGGYTISNLGNALFNSVNGGTVKNVILDDVSISGGTNAGAIANVVTGTSTQLASIYNCGILSGSVSGSGKVGSIVGQLGDSDAANCYARVINCFSYATVSGGSDVGGIVGYNSFASTASNIRTMVMNCMFYGDITSGSSVSPVFGGNNIANLQGGLNTFNYYAYDELKTTAISNNKYNSALAVEEKYLNRFEFYRLLLNSNKKLASFYATGSTADADQKMLKWVLETADRTIDNPKPYPVLKAQGYYPSIINPDFEHAPDSATVGRNQGGKLPSPRNTLTVTISSAQTTGGQTKPEGASITTSSLTLQRTDKDFDRFNYNYDKVQLPYYNDVGTGNYTGNRVVTGWKITAIDAIPGDPYTSSNYPPTGVTDYPNHNYADRRSSNKDLYSVSGRVFSQGAYFDVPYGVTSITIEPYWGKAYYIADANYDVVYKNDYTGKQGVTQTGTQVAVVTTDETSYTTTEFKEQNVETSIERALNNINNNMGGWGPTVYDNALVLVGNLHLNTVPQNGTTPFTMMSVDMDNDHEPDYSLIYHHIGRSNITPIRFDFLNIPGTAQAQKPNSASLICNFTIFKTRGWFEVTNTAFMYSSQIEYENADLGDGVTKIDAPIILLGGVFDQFVSTQSYAVTGKTIYIHVGSNVWINEFGMGTHSDGSKSTPHVPVSVTGGEFPGFYLTGTYNANAEVRTDNAECYISGGYFYEVAGASLEQINGSVRWQIYNADIDQFFGGGINEAKPITGDITTDIYNSDVTLFCGGPKFGNMQADKNVTTNAEGCTFGKFFGAGYGGTSLAKKKYYDETTPDWGTTLQGYYTTDRGLYFDGKTTNSREGGTGNNQYGKKGLGVATDFDYEFFVWSTGKTGGRFFIKFAAFSLAQCNDVSSTLKKCTVNENFYGGGSLGKVVGTATSVLEDCTVHGSAYGGGYSASLPTVEVRNDGFTKVPKYNDQSGMFEPAEFSGTTTFTWQNAAAAGVTLTDGQSGSDLDNHVLYTNADLTTLGEVAHTNLTIKGTTTVGESVYGGGEESGVGGNTEVIVNGGTIGAEGRSGYGYRYGNVYGGGKGKIDNEGNLVVSSVADLDAGLVKGNTSVTINGTKESTKIVHNVYGGGAVGSVGTFTRDANGDPTACADNTGQATITINGGQVGHNKKDSGMVNGSSRGWEGNPEGSFLNQLAWVNNAIVTIGDATTNDEDKGPAILGSVFGGGENGHNYSDGSVTINKGTIGNAASSAESFDCGNVYGAGCGTDTYTIGEDPTTEHHNQKAGWVRGNTSITINGGNILRNVYGAGAMGSVGNDTDAESGKTTININGGTIGRTEDSDHGHVFGGPKGNLTETEFKASVKSTLVNINAHPSDATKNPIVWGSVFGGGEAGIIKGSVAVNMNGGTVKKDVYGGGALADTQTDNWDETKNSGAGDWASGKTSASTTTTVRLTGGNILGEAYGGGLGEPDKPAYVYGDVLLDLNGTTTSGETGTAIAGDARGCAVHEVFGCNNASGTPMGKVMVHIYATQNKNNADISTKAEKGSNSFDVVAVYGGGNLAAYEPAGGASTTNSTNVIIEGCDLTSIQYVYGGGNAAPVPGSHVLVKSCYEIGSLFGGGNGYDDLEDGSPNPGANVGYMNPTYSFTPDPTKSDAENKAERAAAEAAAFEAQKATLAYGSGKSFVELLGGTIHYAFGGSNTKGNVRVSATVKLDEGGTCELKIGEVYGAGNMATQDGTSNILLGCVSFLEEMYGGSRNANINNDIELAIQSGQFHRVFGGNNLGGTISGTITVNIEETGCHPIIIGQFYGGGNRAAYTGPWIDPSDHSKGRLGPTVNVRSFSSIGEIYGGGYGESAIITGNTYVNINECVGENASIETESRTINGVSKTVSQHTGETVTINAGMQDEVEVGIPLHEAGKIGAIGFVYGGGNAAPVFGNTNITIGTLTKFNYVSIQDDAGTAEDESERDVVGVDIRGNVFGGGNKAEVTGNTNVVVGK